MPAKGPSGSGTKRKTKTTTFAHGHPRIAQFFSPSARTTSQDGEEPVDSVSPFLDRAGSSRDGSGQSSATPRAQGGAKVRDNQPKITMFCRAAARSPQGEQRFVDTDSPMSYNAGTSVRVVHNRDDLPFGDANTILHQAATGDPRVRVVPSSGDLPFADGDRYVDTILQKIGDIMVQVRDLVFDLPGRLATLPELLNTEFRPAAPAQLQNRTSWLTSTRMALMRRVLAHPDNATIQRQSRIVNAQTTALLASPLFATYASFSDFAINGLSVRADASFQEFAGQYFLVCRAFISIHRDAWIAHVTAWLLNQDFTFKSVFSALHGDHSV